MSARIVLMRNPVVPLEGALFAEVVAGRTVLETIAAEGWTLAPSTVLVRDNAMVPRRDWEAQPIADGELVALAVVPMGKGGASQIFAVIAELALLVVAPQIGAVVGGFLGLGQLGTAIATLAIVVAGKYAISAILPQPKPYKDNTSQSPTYSLTAQSNRARLGEMIPEPFGEFLHVVDLAAAPWFNFENNQLVVYQLFCRGMGFYDTTEIRNGDNAIYADGAPTNIYPGVEIELVEPGGQVTLVHDNVYTSRDVSNQTLLGTNEENADWMGWFTLNPAGTSAMSMEIDVGCLLGLNKQGSTLDTATVEFQVEAQPIDNTGATTGLSFVVFDETLTLAIRDPFRKTYHYDFATPGRYRVRAKRTNDKSKKTNVVDTLTWIAMRAFMPMVGIYEGRSMLAIKATATQSLNGDNGLQIKDIKTRKLPYYDGAAWVGDMDSGVGLVATQSIAWAAAYLMRSENGAGLADARVDAAKLLALDATWTARGDTFNGIFDSKQTFSQALQSVVQVGRTRWVQEGSLLTFVRDELRTVPRAGFSPRNMLPGTFNIDYALRDPNTVDGFAVSFVDARDWKENIVLAKRPGSTATIDTAAPVQAFGITSYRQAWAEYTALDAANAWRRRITNFQTERDGRPCGFGQMVSLTHYLSNWGGAADVVQLIEHDDGDVLILSEPWPTPLAGDEDEDLLLRVSSPDGYIYGPVPVSIVDELTTDRSCAVKLLDGPDNPIGGKYAGTAPRDWPVWSGDGLNMERPRAAMGQGALSPMDALVVSMTPAQGANTTMQCVIDDARVYTADAGDPPEEATGPDATPAAKLFITALAVAEVDLGGGNIQITVTVSGAPDATSFRARSRAFPAGAFGEITADLANNFVLVVPAGDTELEVFAQSDAGIGPGFPAMFDADGAAEAAPADVGAITITARWDEDTGASWSWAAVPHAYTYLVETQVNSVGWNTVRSDEIDAVAGTQVYTYRAEWGGFDGYISESLRIRVKGKSVAGTSPDWSNSGDAS